MMTANELANELEKWGEPFKPYITMLRQQAEEIDKLKEWFAKNEPVALMYQDSKKTEWTTCTDKAIWHNSTKWFPLYTHPMRELSDATIRELSVTFMLVLRRTSEDELFENVYEYSKLLLKKARGE